MHTIDRVWLLNEPYETMSGYTLAACSKGKGSRGDLRWHPREFAMLGKFEAESEDPGPLDRAKHVAEITEPALNRLAQDLWDLGFRPREALNHDETIKALRSERDFLRGLVEQHLPGPEREKAINSCLEHLAKARGRF